jgi:hypothetical protein
MASSSALAEEEPRAVDVDVEEEEGAKAVALATREERIASFMLDVCMDGLFVVDLGMWNGPGGKKNIRKIVKIKESKEKGLGWNHR